MSRAAQASQNGASGHSNGATASKSGGNPLSQSLYEHKPNQTNTKDLTFNSGLGVPDNDHSLTLGARGPVLLEDAHLQEKLAQFNRERIPERIVHARGMTARGYFECTSSEIADLCSADLFSEVGKRTEVTTRFSTVVHGRESPESLRDVRGFSVKWYTAQGNWDLVGNNIPVFFIRDGKKFVDLNHALKPNPITGVQEGWRILDFLTHHPESTHVLSWLLDVNGIPENWRALEGHSVNTFTLVNKEGRNTLVKFHWLPAGGAKFMNDEEAQAVGSENMRHSHATLDLVDNIRNGNPPSWGFYIQTMDPADQLNHDFDPLDATKTWPEDKFPLKKIGHMVLDTHITSMFSENEQVAFNPANLVPGITASNDKLLQSRLHAYADAHRYRVGINFQQLPINAPKHAYHNNHNEGRMQFHIKDEEVNYWPSNVEHPGEDNASVPASISSERVEGNKVMTDLPKATEDPQYDFRQAGERWRNEISKDEKRAGMFLKHIVAWLSMPKCNEKIRSTWVEYWHQVDSGLGERVKKDLQQALKSC